MRIVLVFISLAALLHIGTAAAKVYKWTDENGQVHFSSQPPRGTDNDVYQLRLDKVPTPPAPAAEKTAEKKSAIDSDDSVELKPEIDPKVASQYCQQAKQAKQQLSENFSRRYKQDDGSVRPFTDKERADMMKRADDAIKSYCK
ncbi:DUF4124 domain-containing protein [Bacterioplanoides pacificum]|uniref:DUF4124 domain-containing protein n=1 Tax=Bacterioplanoides pacificum TaxID=1171596 RepID=A0ABV7VUK2_9GAMM